MERGQSIQGITNSGFSGTNKEEYWETRGSQERRKVNVNSTVSPCMKPAWHVLPQKPRHKRHTCAKLPGSRPAHLIQLHENVLWDRQRVAFCQEDFEGCNPWWWFSWGKESLQRKLIRISYSMGVRSAPTLGLNNRALKCEISSGTNPGRVTTYHQ